MTNPLSQSNPVLACRECDPPGSGRECRGGACASCGGTGKASAKGRYPCRPKPFQTMFGAVMICADCGHYPPPECGVRQALLENNHAE